MNITSRYSLEYWILLLPLIFEWIKIIYGFKFTRNYKMTKTGENIHLILYEFHLQDIEYKEDNKISTSDYGSHVVKFIEDTFECNFQTLTKIGSSKVKCLCI